MTCGRDEWASGQAPPGPVGIVAGSGLELDSLLDHVEETRPFNEIPGLRASPLEGHRRTFIRGRCGGQAVLIQSGRLHFYEGLDYAEVVRPVDLLFEWGVRTMILTSAGGGLLPAMRPGALVAVDEVRTWPYVHWPKRPEVLVTDFRIEGCDFAGTYWWMHGPSYETRAEIRFLQECGGTVVGMSTAPEIARCRELGIRSAVVCCVTNNCCEPHTLTHQEVVSVARKASYRVAALLRIALPTLPATT